MKNNCISPRLFAFAIAMPVMCSLGITKSMAQEWDHEYVPFVEEGKVWYCGYDHWEDSEPQPVTPEDPNGHGIDCIFTMQGDTLIGENNYKKVFCQYEEFYGDTEQHYYCAVREDSYQVFIVESEAKDEKLLYNFSNPKETITIEYDNHKFARSGGFLLNYYSPAPINQYEYGLYEYGPNGEIDIYYGLGTWKEGIGFFDGNPFAMEVYGDKPKLGKTIRVVSCMKDKEFLYQLVWRSQPTTIPAATTSICNTSPSKALQPFDLQGRRLTVRPQRGVYIRDGKRYILK